MTAKKYSQKDFIGVYLLVSILIVSLFISCTPSQTPEARITDTTAPLHLMRPDYNVPYGKMSIEDIEVVLDRVYSYLESTTPAKLVNRVNGDIVTDYAAIDTTTVFAKGDYRLISYEWGVTYAGMLLAAEQTGNDKYAKYITSRFDFIVDVLPYFQDLYSKGSVRGNPMRSVIEPRALDDAGAMGAAMIKATRANLNSELRPIIDNYLDFITNKKHRLADGTLARFRPHPNTLWLDDLFMSVPALAQMGKLTGDMKYYDDAVRQVLQFSARMFNWEKGFYMHGWVQDMEIHPQFHWARANGWAIMTKVELLDVLPLNHPGREQVMKLLRAHIQGLASVQSGEGFWHQLLDRNDSYLETSATAIYTYSIAKAINEGWVDALAYGPMVSLAWNAVTTKVNPLGQVEGTCVGTGMAFDPAFYYYRPVNPYAAHSYGPVLLAGAEMIRLFKNNKATMNDSALQFYGEGAELNDAPIFSVKPY